MKINGITSRGSVPVSGPDMGPSPSKITAAKVNQIKLPVQSQKGGLRDREVTLLKEASDLSKAIKKDWNNLYTEELADQIIALKDKVALLKGSSPAVDKIKEQAEHLHFQFVFPVVLEMDTSPPESSMPLSFARSIYKTANEILKKNSADPFQQLSRTQQREVIRHAIKGGA